MEQEKKNINGVAGGIGKPTLNELRRKAADKYSYWLLINKKGGPDPRVEDKKGYDFMRVPYDDARNAWCFETPRGRARFQSEHGGQEYNLHIKAKNS